LSREDDPRWHNLIKLCAEQSSLLQWRPVDPPQLQANWNNLDDDDDDDEEEEDDEDAEGSLLFVGF
jgi:hypothetical protein